MAFIPQTIPSTLNANSLATVQEFKDYCNDRSIDITALADEDIEALLIKGTDYIVQKYNFKGYISDAEQLIPFPRFINDVEVFPTKVKFATIVLALKAQIGDLYADSKQEVKRKKLEGLEIEYQDFSSSQVIYNEALGYLKEYVLGGGSLNVLRG